MAVLDPDAPPESRAQQAASDPARDMARDMPGDLAADVPVPAARGFDNGAQAIRVEPMIGLEWARAVEPTGPIGAARRPSQTRRAWLHRAPESQVVNLFEAARAVIPDLAAPWWLRALAEGTLGSRLGGFAIEDQVSELLAPRPGWFYMPWTGPGEDGYWEYVPSDETAAGRPLVPTTLMFTSRHPGWLDVIPAHADGTPRPVPVQGPADLRARLPELEAAGR